MHFLFKSLNTFSFLRNARAVLLLAIGCFATTSQTAQASVSCSLAAAGVLAQASHLNNALGVNAKKRIREAVGVCTVTPPSRKACDIASWELVNVDRNPYDGFARSHVAIAAQAMAPDFKHIFISPHNAFPAGSLRSMTAEDFFAIDLLARTIFGEVRQTECSVGYPEAVARTILNRAHTHAPGKSSASVIHASDITAVILKPYQFSLWNKPDELIDYNLAKRPHSCKEHNTQPYLLSSLENTRLALCPGVPEATKETMSAWYRSVDIAMRAIIEEKAFMEETKSFGSIEIYRSEVSKKRLPPWKGRKYLGPQSINGHPLNNPKCMSFWEDVTH